jgi:hypothetical protein
MRVKSLEKDGIEQENLMLKFHAIGSVKKTNHIKKKQQYMLV